MTRNLVFSIFTLLFLLSITGCEKHDHDEEELITTLVYRLTSKTDGSVVELSFRDLDGIGGNPPLIIGGVLKSDQVYDGTISLLNEAVSPVEDITKVVEVEAANHQFFISASTPGTIITYNDKDKNNKPLGLKTILTTGTTGSGNLIIILRHNPDKSAPGVSDGNINNAGGETDIEVNFPLSVQ